MRTSSRLLAIFLCLIVACACFAQGGQGRRGNRQRNGFSLGAIIFRTDVQTDLALTPDEKTKLDALRESFRTPRGAGGGGGTQPTPEERAAREADQAKQIDGVLTPDQSTRLREIQIQIAGIQAIALPAVQTSLGLSSTQTDQIATIMKDYGEANRSVFQKDQGDRDAIRSDMQKNTAALKDNLTKVLTPDQATKLQTLGGKTFTAETTPAGG